LTPHGRRVGLISDADWAEFQAKQDRLAGLQQTLESTRLTSAMIEEIQREMEESRAAESLTCREIVEDGASTGEDARRSTEIDLSSAVGQTLAQLLRRPEVSIERLAPVLRELRPHFFERNGATQDVDRMPVEVRNELKSVETEVKYAGYLNQQQKAIERLKRAEQRNIPEWFDYSSVSGLSREMKEKLVKVRPRTLGHAARIPGVTPAAVSLVNVYIEIQARRREQAASV
jgi:tRNA uridine 5-carboxymethylaminomethyl modification enzyme